MSTPSPVAGAIAAALLVLSACGSTGHAERAGQAPADQHRGAPEPTASATSAGAAIAPLPPRLRVRPAGFRLPAAVSREAVSETGCTAIVAGGFVGGDSSIATAYRLDLDRDRIGPLPRLRVPVHDTAGSVAGGPLVIGGGNAAEQSAVERFDGRAWRVVGHLPQPRSDLVAATVAGRVLVAGGYSGSRPAEPDVLTSTDGRTWTVTGTLPVPVRYPASAVVDGSLWLFGGESAGVTRPTIQRIDAATGRARVVGRLPSPSAHAVALPLGPRVLIAGGRTSGGVVTGRLWWFDTRTGAATGAGHLPHPLSDAGIARCRDSFYLLGGETPAVTDQVLRVTDR